MKIHRRIRLLMTETIHTEDRILCQYMNREMKQTGVSGERGGMSIGSGIRGVKMRRNIGRTKAGGITIKTDTT